MTTAQQTIPADCNACAGKPQLDFRFSMAFQPIVNIRQRAVFAHEALARGPANEPAGFVFAQVDNNNLYRFDQACRVKAIELASRLGMQSLLSINFMPNAVYQPARCIRTTLAAAEKYNFPLTQIIFEITEGEKVEDHAHLRGIVEHYQQRGFKTAIDDFGAGYAGLNMLADMQTDIIKLDMALIRDIDSDKVRQSIVRNIVNVCNELSAQVIAEGIETYNEFSTLADFGIELFQGYYFARPAFEQLPAINPEVFNLN